VDVEQQRKPHPFPRSRQREHLLALISEHDGAVDATELATHVGLHVTTVRFHLDALCDQGALERTRIAPTGVGRPRIGYVAVQGRLDYRSFAEILATELGDTAADRTRRAERAGKRWAERITSPQRRSVAAQDGTRSGTALDRRVETTTEVFQRMGFGPELNSPSKHAVAPRGRTIRLHACPIRELAQSHPEVGCALHLGLLKGLLANPEGSAHGPAKAALRATLEPFVEPELCIARVIARD
jgi:predicted ArsR family transcriptional regulator